MSDKKNVEGKHDSISIIYHQRNDSPKYFEIKRSKVFFLFIILPTIALIALVIGAVGIVHTSPFHIVESYRQNSEKQHQLNDRNDLEKAVQNAELENAQLKSELATANERLNTASNSNGATKDSEGKSCPAPTICNGSSANSIGLSTLSLFKPIQGQKDLTRPSVLNLTGFATTTTRDGVTLQFNIIPSVDEKISGHIVVLMKNELGISAYPAETLVGVDFQINYSSGEPFSTQRFRPVNANFLKPRRAGNYSFTVFIFSKTGDLLRYQTTTLPVKL